MANIKKIVLIMLLIFISACGVNSRKANNVTAEIQTQIAEDMFLELNSQFFPNKTVLLIKPENIMEQVISDLARSGGFAVSDQKGDLLQIKVYYLEEKTSYIATMVIGGLRRITKEYRQYPEGIKQISPTSIGG